MLIHSAGDRIRPGRYRAVSRHSRAVNYADRSGRMLFAVSPSAGPGPLNIVFDDPAALSDSIDLHDDVFLSNGRDTLLPADRYNSSLSALPLIYLEPLTQSVRIFHDHLSGYAPRQSLAFLLMKEDEDNLPGFERAYRERAAQAADALARLDYDSMTSLMKGCGPGLTPAGDDFLCGVMLAIHVIPGIQASRRACALGTILQMSKGTNPLSNTLLELAYEGRFSLHLKQLVRALALKRQIRPSTSKVLMHGATSGADLATGFCLGLSSLCANLLNLPLEIHAKENYS